MSSRATHATMPAASCSCNEAPFHAPAPRSPWVAGTAPAARTLTPTCCRQAALGVGVAGGLGGVAAGADGREVLLRNANPS
eukprot:COSAG01_NODE_1975_length_8751_cov_6.534443_6_plen_81_part_00